MTLRSAVGGRDSNPPGTTGDTGAETPDGSGRPDAASATAPVAAPVGTAVGTAAANAADAADAGAPVQPDKVQRVGRFGGRSTRSIVLGLVTLAVWCAAAFAWTGLYRRTDRGTGLGWDLLTTWRAERLFAHGGAPYDIKAFLYPPSCLLLLRPLGSLTRHELTVGGEVLTLVLAFAAVMITAHALDLKWWGLTSAVTLLVLPYTLAMRAELSLENVTVLGFVAFAAFLAFAVKDHWIAAGVAIGLSLSIKPLMLAVLVVFLVARQWKGLAVAVAIPALLNLVAFFFVAHASQVFTKLPSLLDRTGVGVRYNSAWVDVTRTLGLPVGASVALRVASVALSLAAIWLAWSRLDDPRLRLVVAASAALIASYLAGTLSEDHFMLTLVPLAMTVVIAGSPMRQVTAVVATIWLLGELLLPGSLVGLDPTANDSFFRAVGMSIVLITVVAVLARRPAIPGTELRDPSTWASRSTPATIAAGSASLAKPAAASLAGSRWDPAATASGQAG